MEGRDSSTSTATAVTGDEDASISAAAALAKEAALLFQNRRYSECIDVLKQLLLKKENDPKVLHNKCVAECFSETCTPKDPKILLELLEKLKKRCEELSQASKEQSESTGITGTGTGSRGTGTSLIHQISGSNSGIPILADEFDTSVITLNIALVLYNMHEYTAALTILEQLYQNIEPIDEKTALHVCFLFLDIALAIGDAAKAADVIQYLEKSFGISNQTDSPNTQKPIIPSKTSTSSNPQDSNSDQTGQTGQSNLTPTDIPDEEYENLISTLENLAKTPSDLNSTKADLKLKLQIYKVRLLLLTRNLRGAKRELKLAMNMARGRDSSAELFLKSQLEFDRGNFKKAVKLLSAPSGNRNEIFYNNLGCILHKQGNHQTANLFFNNALKETSNNNNNNNPQTNFFPQDNSKSCIISYNLGLQHLTSQRPVRAAQCFKEAVPLFFEKPLFWVRFAECALLALEISSADSTGEDCKSISVNVTGSGIYRQLVITGTKTGTVDDSDLISLPVARQFLVRAQLLMEIKENKLINGGADFKAHVPAGGLNLSAYEKILKRENLKIKQAILADLAFIDLCLKNPLKALKNAKALINLPECSGRYLFLAHVYSAEALCLLNRVKEASEHLSVYIKGDNNMIELPNFEDEDLEVVERESEKERDGDDSAVDMPAKVLEASSWDINEAKSTVYVNMGIVYALQGDIERAGDFVKQALVLQPENPRVVFANVYVDLLRGDLKEALVKLRLCRNARFLRGNPSLEVGKSG